MKLSQWAKLKGVHYNTAYRWFKENNLPVKAMQLPTGTIIVEENQEINSEIQEVNIYCRVSSNDKKQDLERQAERCKQFCLNNGFIIKKIYKEIASGMNDNRPKLIQLLNSKPKCIIVEHKDRLTRFGFNYLKLLLPKINCKLIVINEDNEEETDLIKDFVAIITSFCCRLYGLRKGQNKIKNIKKELNDKISKS